MAKKVSKKKAVKAQMPMVPFKGAKATKGIAAKGKVKGKKGKFGKGY